MVTFRKVKNWLFRKIVIEHDAKEFAKEFTFARSELLFFVKDDFNLRSLNDKIYSEVSKSLFEIIPSTNSIATKHAFETSNDIMCIRCFSTRSKGYLVYGSNIWLRIKGKWMSYNFGASKWIHSESFPENDFEVTCCGCFGDVNTFHHFEEVNDYYFVY